MGEEEPRRREGREGGRGKGRKNERRQGGREGERDRKRKEGERGRKLFSKELNTLLQIYSNFTIYNVVS